MIDIFATFLSTLVGLVSGGLTGFVSAAAGLFV